MKSFVAYISILFFCSCEHPENKLYERNQKVVENINDLVDEKPHNSSDRNLEEYSQNVLKMENNNGVKYVWIEINGIRLKFIFDTGASDISISPIEASILYKQGTLTKDDILDKEYFQDATGRISVGTKINLRTVKVGNRILQNVQATVVNNLNAPLLMGQSVLENFGKIEIDYTNGEIIFR